MDKVVNVLKRTKDRIANEVPASLFILGLLAYLAEKAGEPSVEALAQSAADNPWAVVAAVAAAVASHASVWSRRSHEVDLEVAQMSDDEREAIE